MNSITLSLFDFLNYEVIGYLMLRICGFAPCQRICNCASCQDGDWLFYVIAYIVGLVIVKLNEKTPWSECMRNNRCFIEKGNGALRKLKCGIEEDNMKKYQYYKKYYHVLGDRVGNTISILESQYAFVWNLLFVVVVYFVTFLVRGGCLFGTINDKTFACCNRLCLFCCDGSVSLNPLFYSISILMLFRTLGFVFNFKEISIRQKKCRIVLFILVELVLLIIIVSYFVLSKGETYIQIGFLLALIVVALPFIAFSIQSKISELIIENDHFLSEMEKDRK